MLEAVYCQYVSILGVPTPATATSAGGGIRTPAVSAGAVPLVDVADNQVVASSRAKMSARALPTHQPDASRCQVSVCGSYAPLMSHRHRVLQIQAYATILRAVDNLHILALGGMESNLTSWT